MGDDEPLDAVAGVECLRTISWRLTPLKVAQSPGPCRPRWPLGECCACPRAAVEQPQPSRHRDAQENDDPDVRHTLVADVLEHRDEPDRDSIRAISVRSQRL
jgi:hypothetical protein